MAGLGDIFGGFETGRNEYHPYYHFEPWDCTSLPPHVLTKAAEDGVDLEYDDAERMAGPYPRPFQSGAILSKKLIRIVQAGSQTGKSIAGQVLLGCVISRQPPYAFRYPEGVDTGIARAVTKENVRRFGRRDAATGKIIDYNDDKVAPQGGPMPGSGDWNCGNIVGVGIFPEELYAPKGSQIWIGTLKQSLDTLWWPVFTGEGASRFFPEDFIDTSKGRNGSNKNDRIIHCMNGIDVHIKSYDGGELQFESKTAWMTVYDEEPLTKAIYLSGIKHAKYHVFQFTPLKGMTWSKDVFFGCLDDGKRTLESLAREDFDYYHASAYDSPYVDKKFLETTRRSMRVWERKSRIWGQYSECEGEPFFARDKIQAWRRRFSRNGSARIIEAVTPFHGIYGTVGIPGILQARTVSRQVDALDLATTWRVFEDVKEGTGYGMVVDSAEGAVDPVDSNDFQFALVFRMPDYQEVEMGRQPVVCATIRSHLPTKAFSRICMQALHHYNNALLVAERGRGKDNEAFGVLLEEWPYWYYHQAKNAATGQYRRKKGFDTNSGNRTEYFISLKDLVDGYETDEDPGILCDWILSEMAAAIIKTSKARKTPRCDHPDNGYLDGTICYGIANYLLDDDEFDLVCNVEKRDEKHGFIHRMGLQEEGQKPAARIPMGSPSMYFGGQGRR